MRFTRSWIATGVALATSACVASCSSTDFTPSADAGGEADGAVSDGAVSDGPITSEDGGPVGPDAAPDAVNGCADGTREYYESVTQFPNIAGCSGGFGIKGFAAPVSCGHSAGTGKEGVSCSAQDLCAAGWHVCTDAAQFAIKGGDPCPLLAAGAGLFYATRQRSAGQADCDPASSDSGTDDIFGCGSLGAPTTSCGKLTQFLSEGAPSGEWSLGTMSGDEWEQVSKGPDNGGVLCCTD